MISCVIEISILFVRHLIYRFSEGVARITHLASGLAIKMWQFVKETVQVIISNGLATAFSLGGGALGMLIPIPVVNVIVSALFGAIGYALGRYLAGIPSNIYRYLTNKNEEQINTNNRKEITYT